MTTAAFTFNGQDLGALYGLILERRRIGLIPATRDRFLQVPGRHGSWDFGTELGERHIDLDCFISQNSSAALETAISGIASAFDPTNEVAGDKGFKQLIFDTLSDRYFLAKITGMPDPERIVTTGKVKLTMRCNDPFAYSTVQYVVDGGAATITGFSAYRQAPEKIGWNLVRNGGFVTAMTASDWSNPHANASRVVDATSVSGFALRTLATGAGQYSIAGSRPIEAGKPYSFAVQIRGDGTNVNCAFIWRDAGGLYISEVDIASTSAVWAEVTSANNIAPNNARFLDVWVCGPVAAGIGYVTAVRVKQQTAAPAAWTAADQQNLEQKGLEIFETGTNSAADGDMEAVGTASYAATNATLAKDTGTFFGGAKSLKVTNTLANGYASQTGALAAGQAITASVRASGGDAGTGLALFSTPSNAQIGATQFAVSSWAPLRVSGVIAGADTGWQVRLIGGSGAATVANFDNLAVENKTYDTMNVDPSGQAFALAARTASNVQLAVPNAFDLTDFAIVGVTRFDHAFNGHGTAFERFMFDVYVDGNNRLSTFISVAGSVAISKVRGSVISQVLDGGASAFAAGDTVAWAARFSATAGLKLFVSKNGGAVATYSLATLEALLPFTGTPTFFLGRFGGGAGYEIDGAMGVLRILKAAQSDATISALVLNPYQAQDESYELAVWRFEGAAVPEDYASGVELVDVGGTFQTPPIVEMTAGAGFTGAITFTDSYGNVLTWTGTVALNDVLKVDTTTYRVYLNGAVSMSGLGSGSIFPQLKANQRNTITVGGIPSASVKALRTTFRNRWLY